MKRNLILLSLAALLLASCDDKVDEKAAVQAHEELLAGWQNPPQSARTRVWWHWMNGNITKDGIRKDLEWMHRIGLAGFHNFDAAMATPDIVEKRLIYMDEGWQDAFAYATRLADSLGLEMTVASSPGWSTTGGPWVQPQDAMKKLVWKTILVEGGSRVDQKLPEPFKTTGAFQNGPVAGRGFAGSAHQYYEDVAVIAVKQPDGIQSLEELGASITSSGGHFTLAQLTDGDVAGSSLLPSAPEGFAWIQYTFDKPVTIRAITLTDGSTGGFGGSGGATSFLESSTDGRNFTQVAPLPGGGVVQRTLSVPATTAQYFRVTFKNPRAAGAPWYGGPAPAAPKGTDIAELVLHTTSRVNQAEDKAAYSARARLTEALTPASPDETFATPEDVMDITSFVKDGNLVWNAPEGQWKVFRFGWSLTGKMNHPAPLEATGLEVDKMDPEAWTRFFRTYFDMYKKASGGMLGERGVQYVLNDSYEAEQETWTPAMFQEFQTRRGYDLHTWLPVLTGEIIGSPEQSDAFLFDWRMTISDLITANYDLLTDIAQKEYGMKGRYTESHEGGRAYVVDGMDVKRTSQVPMSAMWVTAPWLPTTPDGDTDRTTYNLDGMESASVAHIYGQNVAAAESMTAPGGEGRSYAYHPGNLKFVADLELSNGTNRFVIHESAHQPSDEHVPGLSLGGIGQWFNRHDAWAEQAGVWVDYMSRSSFMLQAGKNVADVLIYYGEDANITNLYNALPAVPEGYRYDFASPDVLLNQVQPEKGELVAKLGGVRYKVLWLNGNVNHMSVEILQRLAALAQAGIPICGSKPAGKAGQAGSQEEFDSLVAQIWACKNVYEGNDIASVLKSVGLDPDFMIQSVDEYKYLHRTLPGAEVYWVNKPSKNYETVKASFRVIGLRPQIWHPESGRIEDATYEIAEGRTVVTLNMVPDDALFVVFNGKGAAQYTIPATKESIFAQVDSPWIVQFQEKRGAPESATFVTLQSYTESADPGIKYFSGVASYQNTFRADGLDGEVFIDLGKVADLAEVWVNGQYCGTAWKEPYRVDISSAVKEGDNSLEVKVANVWVNRLIGDEQPGAKRVTWCDSRGAYRADSPLNLAGLLGPVQLICRK